LDWQSQLQLRDKIQCGLKEAQPFADGAKPAPVAINATTVVALGFGAFSVGSALFLIMELSEPFTGLFRIPSAAMGQMLAAPGGQRFCVPTYAPRHVQRILPLEGEDKGGGSGRHRGGASLRIGT
jgi:hypothetical protein